MKAGTKPELEAIERLSGAYAGNLVTFLCDNYKAHVFGAHVLFICCVTCKGGVVLVFVFYTFIFLIPEFLSEFIH